MNKNLDAEALRVIRSLPKYSLEFSEESLLR